MKRADDTAPAARLFRSRKKPSIFRDSRMAQRRKTRKNHALLPN